MDVFHFWQLQYDPIVIAKNKKMKHCPNKQVHSLCVDSRPGDRLRLAKGHPHPIVSQSEAHGRLRQWP